MWLLAVVAVSCLALCLRLYGLDFQSLWRDEVDSLYFAQRDLPEHIHAFAAAGENGPLYFALLSAWLSLFGSSEVALRLPSALFGAAAVPIAIVLAKRWLSRGTALVSGLILASSPFAVWYSQEAKMYALLLTVSLAATAALTWALDTRRRRVWVCYALLMTASFYVHLFAVLLLLVHWLVVAVGSWAWSDWRPSRKAFVLTSLALVGPYLPLALWQGELLLRPPAPVFPQVAISEAWQSLLFAFSLNSAPTVPATAVLGPLALVAAALVAGAGRDRAGNSSRVPVGLLAIYFATAPAVTLALQPWTPLFVTRYFMPSLAPFVLLLAAGAMAIARRSPFVAACVLLLVIVSNLQSIWFATHTPIKTDFRAAAAFVEARLRPGDRTMFVMPYVERAFRYYAPDVPTALPVPLTNGGMAAAEVNARLSTVVESGARLWLVLSEANAYDERGLIPRFFEERAVRRELGQFTGVEVRLYELIHPADVEPGTTAGRPIPAQPRGPATPAVRWTIDSVPAWSRLLTLDGEYFALTAGSNGELQLVDERGAQWRVDVGRAISGLTLANDRSILVGSDTGLYALTIAGNTKWMIPALWGAYSRPAISPDGLVYATTLGGELIAVRSDGTMAWRRGLGPGNWMSPVIGADRTILVFNAEGQVTAIRPDQSTLWSFDVQGRIASPVAIADDGTVYAGSTNGSVYSISANGQLRWRHPTVGSLTSTPVISAQGDILVGGGDGYLYAFDAAGAARWRAAVGGSKLTTPEVDATGTAFVGSLTGIHSVSPSGIVLWSFPINGTVEVSPILTDSGALGVVADGFGRNSVRKLYVLTQGGQN